MRSMLLASVSRGIVGSAILGAAVAMPAAFAQAQQVSGDENLDEVTVYATRAVTATTYNFGFCANGLERTVEATLAYRF